MQDNNPSQEYIVVKNEDEATLQTLSIKNILNICSLTKTNIPFVQRLYKARGLYSKHPSLEKRLRFVKNRLGLASYFAYKFNVLGGTWLSIASANKEHRYLLDEKLKSYFQKGTYF